MLGAGCLWGLWNSYSAIFRPKKSVRKVVVGAAEVGKPAMAPLANAGGGSPSASISGPSPVPSPGVFPVGPSHTSDGRSLGDLRDLEIAPAELNNREVLIKAGERSLDAKCFHSPEPPALRSSLWARLFSAPALRSAPSTSVAATETIAHGATLPNLDFVIEHQNTGRREAWFGGQAFREGGSLGGAHRIQQITAQGVWISGPAGRRFIPTGEASAKNGVENAQDPASMTGVEPRTTETQSAPEPGPSMPLEVK